MNMKPIFLLYLGLWRCLTATCKMLKPKRRQRKLISMTNAQQAWKREITQNYSVSPAIIGVF